MTNTTRKPTDSEKAAVWSAYFAGRPTRVPLRWNVNPRAIIQNSELNAEGWTFEAFMKDPETCIRAQIRLQEYCAETLSATCDASSALPDVWHVAVCTFNTYEGSYFGAPYGEKVRFHEGQCPTSEHFLTENDVDEFLAQDFSQPLDNPWVREMLAFREELAACAASMVYRGRPVRVAPFLLGGSDGVVTAAADLFGADFFCILGAEPECGDRLMEKLLEAQIQRTKALALRAGVVPMEQGVGYADDSVQLLSCDMYEKQVLPKHRRWYEAFDPEWRKGHGIHLCGDATRHFPVLRRVCKVTAFDTGFPVDFAWLREALGPETEVCGGVPVATIMSGTAQACHDSAKAILQSGIMRGGKFVLQEANNLPPCAPLKNLSAIYAACLEYGNYPIDSYE